MANYAIVKNGKIYTPTRRRREYYKYGTEPNVSIVGSPTIVDGVASGFTTANYLTTPKVFNPLGSEVECVFKINLTALNRTNPMISQGANVQFNKFLFSVLKTGQIRLNAGNGSATIVRVDSNVVLEINKDYWLKLHIKDNVYSLYYSLDGKDYIFDNSVTDTDIIREMTTTAYIGAVRDPATGSSSYFNGSIDLRESYIKINGEDWWHGTKIVRLDVDGGDKYEDWTQPSLTANGTLGGDSFAVTASAEHNGTWGDWRAYHAFNGDLSDKGWSGNSNTLPQHIIFYNPEKLLVSNIKILNHEGNNGGFTAGNIYGSNDGSDWVLISPFTNDVITKGTAWDIVLASNKKPYKYHKIEITATQGFSSTNTVKCKEIYITAQELKAVGGIVEDADYYVDRNVAYDLVYKSSEVISQTFNVSSELQTYVVPEGVSKVNVVCTASKGGNTGGAGGSVKCDLSVTEGQTLYVMVGGIPADYNVAVYNASDIRIGGTGYENRIIIAGGGGGGKSTATQGGLGGGLIGGSGKQEGYQTQATGGTQSEGGKHSVASGGSPYELYYGKDGGYALGGNGGSRGGGSGGAGYYGGGGGGAIVLSGVGPKGSGGAGGSSYTDNTLCANVEHTQGINNGEGFVKISYIKELK
jgi:hypothetical protein